MCGIAGYSNYHMEYLGNKEHWSDVLMKMAKSIAHRGPDDGGIY